MPLTILVVEDDLGTRLSISDYLEAVGYFVVAAENGQEALKKVEQFQPHLIITDITMPRLDGYGLVRQLRQRPALRLLPVIFLTARTATQERVRGYELGCDAYLAKPFELQELGAVVRNLLERQQIVESERRFSREKSNATTGIAKESDLVFEMSIETAEHGKKAASPGTIALLNLTQREQDVLKILADGLSNVQIGEHLHLSPRTVEKYVSSLLKKTETNNRAELVRFAMDNHLVE
jgi:DNA-binding NarL/FixJ family response regulator